MNWVELMALLKEAGYTQPQIAVHCKCAQSTISDIARGVNEHPRYEIGEALKRLAPTAKRRIANRAKPAAAAQLGSSPASRDAFLAAARDDDDLSQSIDNTSKG